MFCYVLVCFKELVFPSFICLYAFFYSLFRFLVNYRKCFNLLLYLVYWADGSRAAQALDGRIASPEAALL